MARQVRILSRNIAPASWTLTVNAQSSSTRMRRSFLFGALAACAGFAGFPSRGAGFASWQLVRLDQPRGIIRQKAGLEPGLYCLFVGLIAGPGCTETCKFSDKARQATNCLCLMLHHSAGCASGNFQEPARISARGAGRAEPCSSSPS